MKPANGVSWFVENYGVTLANPDGTLFVSIPYPYAALWALIANGNFTPEYASRLLATITSINEEDAGRLAVETLDEWKKQNIITTESNG